MGLLDSSAIVPLQGRILESPKLRGEHKLSYHSVLITRLDAIGRLSSSLNAQRVIKLLSSLPPAYLQSKHREDALNKIKDSFPTLASDNLHLAISLIQDQYSVSPENVGAIFDLQWLAQLTSQPVSDSSVLAFVPFLECVLSLLQFC